MAVRTDRSTINPLAQWVIWLVLGAANALLLGIGGVMVVTILLVLALRAATHGDTLSALSGLLLGFGALWLALLAGQSASGGLLDGPEPWIALGIVPAGAGVFVGFLRLTRSRLPRAATE